MEVELPCGGCIGCKKQKSRVWAMRCMHEASLYKYNCFVTLTFAEEHLPPLGSLDKAMFVKFMKRLRKKYEKDRIRFFACGEYGSDFGRPHYHVCLFGFDFPDKVFLGSREGRDYWRSKSLERLWPFGISEIGSVTYASAQYVASYCLKKVTSEDEEWMYQRLDPTTGALGRIQPEYGTMSGGLGRAWIDKYADEVYLHDSVVFNGREVKPPRYYDGRQDEDKMKKIKRRRARMIDPAENTPERLTVREVCAIAKLDTFTRSRDL